jgi:hypothetical protein
MISILEIFCIWIVLFGFLKNIKNWKRNIVHIVIFSWLSVNTLKKLSRNIGFDNFKQGVPLCTIKNINNDIICLNYAAMLVFLTGQILWSYYAFPNTYTRLPTTKASLFYTIHCLPIFMIFFGFLHNWTLNVQLAVDITLLYASSLLGEFKIEEYLGKK